MLLLVEGYLSRLPVGGRCYFAKLHSGDFVLWAIGGPVAIVGGDNIGAGYWMVEGGVDHAGFYSLGNIGAQYGVADPAVNAYPVAMVDTALFCIMWVNLNQIFTVP